MMTISACVLILEDLGDNLLKQIQKKVKCFRFLPRSPDSAVPLVFPTPSTPGWAERTVLG